MQTNVVQSEDMYATHREAASGLNRYDQASQGTVKRESSSDKPNIQSEISDLEVARLGSQPLRERLATDAEKYLVTEVATHGVLKQISSEVCKQIVADIITNEVRRLNADEILSTKDDLMKELVRVISEVISAQKLDSYSRIVEQTQPITKVSSEMKDRCTQSYSVPDRNITSPTDQVKKQSSLKKTIENSRVVTEKDFEDELVIEIGERMAAAASSNVLTAIIENLLREVKIYTHHGDSRTDRAEKSTDGKLISKLCSSITSETQKDEKDVQHCHSVSSSNFESVVPEILRNIRMESNQQLADSISSKSQMSDVSANDESANASSEAIYTTLHHGVNTSVADNYKKVANVNKREIVDRETAHAPRLISSSPEKYTKKDPLQSSGTLRPDVPEVVKSLSSDIIQQMLQVIETTQSTSSNEMVATTHDTHSDEIDDIRTPNSSLILYKIIDDIFKGTAGATTRATIEMQSDSKSSTHALPKEQQRKSKTEEEHTDDSSGHILMKTHESVQMTPQEQMTRESDDKRSDISIRSISSEYIKHLISDVLNAIVDDNTVKSTKSFSSDDVQRRGPESPGASSKKVEKTSDRSESVKSLSSNVIEQIIENVLKEVVHHNATSSREDDERKLEKSTKRTDFEIESQENANEDQCELSSQTSSNVIQRIISDIIKSKLQSSYQSRKVAPSVSETVQNPQRKSGEENVCDDSVRSYSSRILHKIIYDILSSEHLNAQSLQRASQSTSSQQMTSDTSTKHLELSTPSKSNIHPTKGVSSDVIKKVIFDILQTMTYEQTDGVSDSERSFDTIELEHITARMPQTADLPDKIETSETVANAEHPLSALLSADRVVEKQHSDNSIRHVRSLSSDIIQDIIRSMLKPQHHQAEKAPSVGGTDVRRVSSAVEKGNSPTSSVILKIIEDILLKQQKSEGAKPELDFHASPK